MASSDSFGALIRTESTNRSTNYTRNTRKGKVEEKKRFKIC